VELGETRRAPEASHKTKKTEGQSGLSAKGKRGTGKVNVIARDCLRWGWTAWFKGGATSRKVVKMVGKAVEGRGEVAKTNREDLVIEVAVDEYLGDQRLRSQLKNSFGEASQSGDDKGT